MRGKGEDDYLAVNALLGLSVDGTGDWPAGILSHVAGPTPTGWIVSEIWDTKESHQAFLAARLGPALAGANGAPHFTGPAFWRIYGYSHGIPRLVNSVCDKALLAGFVEHSDRISYRLVGRAIRELEGHIQA